MTETTLNLGLPLIAASQAQKHVTQNEALARLDGLIHIRVESRDLTAPPAEPDEGERHIIGAEGTGDFSGRAGQITTFESGAWTYLSPGQGWLAWVADDQALLVHHDGAWQEVTAGGGSASEMLGINATADASNRLAVASPGSLFTHDTDDHRLKINKATETDTASLVFQTSYSGRAEFGLAGSNDFSIKVSPDGEDWLHALTIDAATGAVSLPNTVLAASGGGAASAPPPNLLINADFRLNQRGVAGGSLSSGVYGFDRWKAGSGGASASRSGGVLTLTSGSILQVIEPLVFGHDSIAGQTLTISLDHVSGAAVTVTAFGTDMVLNDVGGRPEASFTVPGGHTGNVTLEIKAPSGSVGLSKVKAEIAGAATPFEHRPLPQEEILANRYYKRIEGPISLFLYAQAYGNYFFNSLPTPVTMRATPSVTRALGAYGNIFNNDANHAMAAGLSPTAFRLSVRANGSGECYATFNAVMLDAEL